MAVEECAFREGCDGRLTDASGRSGLLVGLSGQRPGVAGHSRQVLAVHVPLLQRRALDVGEGQPALRLTSLGMVVTLSGQTPTVIIPGGTPFPKALSGCCDWATFVVIYLPALEEGRRA